MVKHLDENQTAVKTKTKTKRKTCRRTKKNINSKDKAKKMFPPIEQDHQQILFGDQYVPDMRYLPNIKLEPYFETAYYPTSSHSIDLNTTKFNLIDKNSFHTPCFDGYHTTTTNTNLLNLGREPSPTHLGPDTDQSLTPNLPCDTVVKPQKIAKKTRTRKSRNSSTCGKVRSRLSSDSGLPREKDRARVFNEAFEGLRKRIPSIPATKKLSKIEILRLAICYMSYLKFVTTDDPFLVSVDKESADQLS
ncbi:transcription factor 21-like [Clytia hemisphaerica]|uniref:BHLH domain-containing protein n=1 Tax=Clytia hemisphaerica TaxID=252671 RepID=A0A7M5V6N7_9CNID